MSRTVGGGRLSDAAAQFTTLHVTNAYHESSGGVRTFYHALLAAAERRGRHLHLVVPSERAHTERLGSTTWIHHVAAAPAPFVDRRYRLLTPRHYVTPRSPVAHVIAQAQPAIVEICDKYTLVLLARLLRLGWHARGDRPTVVGSSAERLDDAVRTHLVAGRVGEHIASCYIRYGYHPSFDVHIANSTYCAAELRSGATPLRPVHVCTPGVAAQAFARTAPDATLRERLLTAAGGDVRSLLVLYAGRLAREKHLDLLIDAIGVLNGRGVSRDVRLVLVGDGPDRDRLLRQASTVARGRVVVVRHIADPATLGAHYASADVFVHPNPCEPFGIAPLEAMACGTPVVVSDRGGVRSYAHTSNAWLAAPRPLAIAAAILAAAAGRSESRVDEARRTAFKHDWDTAADRYLMTLDQVHRARLRECVATSQRPHPDLVRQ